MLRRLRIWLTTVFIKVIKTDFLEAHLVNLLLDVGSFFVVDVLQLQLCPLDFFVPFNYLRNQLPNLCVRWNLV